MSGFFARRTLDQRYPNIDAIEAGVRRKVPKFAADYLLGGIDREDGLRRNVDVMSSIRFTPRYLTSADDPVLETKVLGQTLPAPFAPGPIGLTGLMWPDAPLHVARAAAKRGLACGLSTYATSSIEEVGAIMGKNLWFQLYPIADHGVEDDLLARFAAVGGEVLMVTVDIPGPTRRARDIRNGLTVPPRQDWRTYLQGAMRPRWALETLKSGLPHFKTIERYVPNDGSKSALDFLTSISGGHTTREKLERLRKQWPGKLVIKGVLSLEDARLAAECGADGIIVSNHGGRQLDAAPTSPEVLPAIRQAVGDRMAILADGGVRTGLDIARMLAIGADFVLLGRAVVMSVAALGAQGPDHALHILTEEFRNTLCQIGCREIGELGRFLQD